MGMYILTNTHISSSHSEGYAVAQWLGLYLQLLGVAMVAGVSFLAVLEHHFSTVDPGIYSVTQLCRIPNSITTQS